MPLPRSLARFNLRVTNPLLRPLAARLPGFAVIEHAGRRTGIRRRTPVNLFRHGDDHVVPLTYGADAEWVRNVLAAGGCTAQIRGRRVELAQPRVVRDERATRVPAAVRLALRALDVDDFLVLRRAER